MEKSSEIFSSESNFSSGQWIEVLRGGGRRALWCEVLGSMAVGGLVGWLGWGQGVEGWRLIGLLLLPVIWGLVRTRWAAFAVMCAYFLAGARELPSGTIVFFGEQDGFWVGWGSWLAFGLLLALPYALFWRQSRPRGQVGRGGLFLLAVAEGCVPPLGLMGGISPLWASGALFPGAGWAGLGLWAAMAWGLVDRRWSAVGGLVLMALVLNVGHREARVPSGWSAVDTHFARLSSGGGGYAGGILAGMERRRWLAEFGGRVGKDSVVWLPETVIGPLNSLGEAELRAVESELAGKASRVVVGAEVQENPGEVGGKYWNSVVVLGGGDSDDRYGRQDIPVPISMWKPWGAEGAVGRVFGRDNVIAVKGVTVGVLVCYEQLLSWSLLRTMVGAAPNVLVGVSNVWWVTGKSIPVIQEQGLASLARLFGRGYLVARNW